MENSERTDVNDLLLKNIGMRMPISNFLSTLTLTHNLGNTNDMAIKSNHNVSHIENIMKLC